MARNSTDRIISCSRWLALIASLLSLPLAAYAAPPDHRVELARVSGAAAVPLVDDDLDGVPVPTDCDDHRADVHPAFGLIPAAPEICDGRDNDCDTQSDEGPGYTQPGTSCSAGTGACEGFTDSSNLPAEFVCTADHTSSECNAVPEPDGTPCDDGDQCTGPDACTAGSCSGNPTLVTVSPNNMNGWAFNVDSPDGTGTFVVGPGTPPLGADSARLFTGTNGDWSAQIRNSDYNGTKLSDLAALSYSTYATSWNGQQLPYLSLEVDYDNDGVLDDRLFFEPPYQSHATGNPTLPDQGSEQLITWQTWNARVGGWWSNSGGLGDTPGTGVLPLSAWITAYPNAVIRNRPDLLGGIRLAVGYASNTDVFDGNVDNVIIGVLGVEKAYDFEATDSCTDNNDCTADSCVPGTGCVSTNLPANTACGDPDSTDCNAPDSCDAVGTCVDRKKSGVSTDTLFVDFEDPPYTLGGGGSETTIDGQDGWSSLGAAGSGTPFDHKLSGSDGIAGFGAQSLRISSGVTSGSFGDQTFSKSLPNEVGETTADNGGLSGGTRMNHFEAEWSFASKVPGAEQPGLHVDASPDRGDAARMSFVRMRDTATGLAVDFFDYQDLANPDFGGVGTEADGCTSQCVGGLSPAPGTVCNGDSDCDTGNGGTCSGGDSFYFTTVATGLDRTILHTIKVTLDTIEGPRNDVVTVYVDGALKHTGTSWEDYFRWCEATDTTRTVDSIIFHTRQAADGSAGNGFLIDNLTLRASAVNICRAAGGVCDVEEYCDGTNNDCPADDFEPAATVCRLSAGQCDLAEQCTGASATCPSDLKSTALCRPSAGQCDQADSCNGTDNDCPPDAFEPDSTLCGGAANGNPCDDDAADHCLGTADTCVDAFQDNTFVCRADTGQCDTAELCDGATSDCPLDVFELATVPCTGTSQADDCDDDPTDHCLGTADTCVDAFKSAATVCRADGGECDVAESCDGVAGACPADLFEPATTACVGVSHGDACDDDALDRCTGTDASCVDAFKSAATECRAAAGDCDVAESCTSTSGACPADAVEPNSTVCRPDAGIAGCDVAESCTGGSGETIYDSIPGPPLPFNRPSQPFQAQQGREFGDDIQFAGANRFVTDVTVTMSTWAPHSQWPGYPDPAGWTHAITLNIYDVDLSGLNPALGPLLTTVTLPAAAIPWRPEGGDPTCAGAPFFPWRAVDGDCYNGLAFNITFPVNAALPDRVIWGIEYNTQTYGPAPMGVGGPYDSLNVAVRNTTADGPVLVGIDSEADAAFFNSINPGQYNPASGCPGGTFCRDVAWTPFVPAARFNAVPVGTVTCPTDAFAPDTILCTGAANGNLCDLDAADHCSGTADACLDAFQLAGYVCRADAGDCDVPESCTGTASACPGDLFEPPGTTCNDGLVCTSFDATPSAGDQCDGSGDCDGLAVSCASDGNDCTDDVCSEAQNCHIEPTCDISGTVVYNMVNPLLYRCNAGPNAGLPCTTNAFCVAPNLCLAGTDAANPANPIGDALMTLSGAATDSTLTAVGPIPAAGTYSFSLVAGLITDTPTRSATLDDITAGLDSSDSSLISKRSVGLVGPFTSRMFKAGDVSTNGAISAFDAALVSQRAINLITSWPAPSTLGSTMWFFDPVSRSLNVNTTPGPNNADFVGVMYGDVSMSWVGPANPSKATERNLPDKWLSLDPARIQGIVAAPGATSTIYISQAPVLRDDGLYEMVLGLSQADGIMGLDLKLRYNPSIVDIESITPVGLADLFAIDSNAAAGAKRVAMYSPAPMEGTGDFLVIRMRIKRALGGLPFELSGTANEGAIRLNWLSPESGTLNPGGPDRRGRGESSFMGGE